MDKTSSSSSCCVPYSAKDEEDCVQHKRNLREIETPVSLPSRTHSNTSPHYPVGRHFNSFFEDVDLDRSSVEDAVIRWLPSTVVVVGSSYGIILSLLKVKAKLQSEFVHIFYCTALQLSLEMWDQDSNSLKVFLEKSGIVQSVGENVVLLIDQFSDQCLRSESILNELLDKTLLPKCAIVLGSSDGSYYNSSITKSLKLKSRQIDQDCSDILNLINVDLGSDCTVEYIKANCIELCSSVELLELALTEFNKRAPRTLAMMMEPLILKLMKVDATSLSALPSRTLSKFLCISKLAYLNIDNNEEGFDFQDVSRCLTLDTYNVAFGSMKNAGMGLLLYPNNTEETGEGKCRFYHPMVQEFLAAFFIANEPLLSQINIFKLKKLLLDSKYSNLCKFYFGIGQLLKNTSHGTEQLKSEIHFVYSCLLGSIDLGYTRETLSDRQNENVLFVYELLDQSQNSDLIRKFFSKRQKDLTLSLNATKLPDSLVVAISYIITNSGVQNWTVSNHKNMKNTADFISLLVKSNSSRKVNVRTRIISEEKFIAQPTTTSDASNSKPRSSDCTYVKCMREILHKYLQVFSPIKIKSSSSETSYVSFLACDCLKDKFEESQIIKFEPIQAFHWLRSPVVQQKLKKRGSRSSREAQDFQEHMSRLHNMEQVELVIMISPLPERLYYLEPHGTVRRCIELYRHTPEVFYKNAIVESCDGTFLNSEDYADIDAVVSAESTRKDNRFVSKLSQMVVPRLPIPKSNLDAVFDHDSPRTPNVQPYEVAPMSLPDLNYQSAKKAIYEDSGFASQAKGKMTRSEVKPPVKPLGVKGIGDYNFVGTETVVTQESSNSRAQIQRQVAVEAGTVLYSTMPNAFTVDVRYPCPEESRLIKKGGNGAIYGATYGRYDFAVKKTPYRSREIEIHKMLKHPNIVELKCLMFGHQQPEHKRRYFSYHFMSKYSGNLSRMVTNKPELTMVTLNQKYKGNPRLLGSMQGNWKYILKEMLKGLGFMHAKNVIHRDMKASNILIKMFCECENLLTCTCTYKYSVCIADFDAAVILDSNGSIPPTSVSNHNQLSPAQRNIYQIVPVGTDGYRAPESAQMVVSNDLSILDPPLTVKADIWSVGLVMIRMLNGANGPTKQQKVIKS